LNLWLAKFSSRSNLPGNLWWLRKEWIVEIEDLKFMGQKKLCSMEKEK